MAWNIVRDTFVSRDGLRDIGDYYKSPNRHLPSHGLKRRIILCEFNELASSHVIYGHICNELSLNEGAEILAYVPKFPAGFKERIFNFFIETFRLFPYNIYRSFGTSGMITPRMTDHIATRADSYFEDFKKITDLRDIEEFRLNGILLGDLLYDDYLIKYRRATIDISDPHFLKYAYEFICLFAFWKKIFDDYDVRAVNVSHCVYASAIPLRIALQYSIDTYQTSLTHVYKLRKDNMFAYREFVTFKSDFEKLPQAVKEAGIAEARKRIERRFSGEVGVDMPYSTRSAFTREKHDQLIKPSDRTKVLIAAHCFFDAVHCFGTNLFPDFSAWMEYLGDMSERTNYDWYIKLHPDFIPGNQDVLDSILVRFPKIKQLPSDASHHQIIAEGIDVVLTVYGTIGFEYAALGIPVINASLNNPHIDYSFNIHPKNLEEYETCVSNLENVELKIDNNEIYSYYYMKNIANTSDLFVNDHDQFLSDIGGYANQTKPAFYQTWNFGGVAKSKEHISAGLQKFIASDDFRMTYSHISADKA